jgi:hypothetical protein
LADEATNFVPTVAESFSSIQVSYDALQDFKGAMSGSANTSFALYSILLSFSTFKSP